LQNKAGDNSCPSAAAVRQKCRMGEEKSGVKYMGAKVGAWDQI